MPRRQDRVVADVPTAQQLLQDIAWLIAAWRRQPDATRPIKVGLPAMTAFRQQHAERWDAPSAGMRRLTIRATYRVESTLLRYVIRA